MPRRRRDHEPLRAGGRRRPTRSIRTRSCRTRTSTSRRRRARGPAAHQPRRALHLPQHRPRARGRRQRADGRLRPRACPDSTSVEYILTNPTSSDARVARRGVPRRVVRRSSPRLPRCRSDARIAGSPTTGRCSRRTGGRDCAATSRASIATTTASRIRPSRRSTTSRPTIRATPRSASAVRLSAATSAILGDDRRPSAGRPHQVKLFGSYDVTEGAESGRRLESQLGRAVDAACRASALQHGRRNSGDRSRRGHRDDRRLHDAHAIQSQIDLQASYKLKLGKRRNDLTLSPTCSTCSTRRPRLPTTSGPS